MEDKLYLAKYKLDEEPHLIIRDQAKCVQCKDKPCMVVCPAEVYAWEQEQNTVSYDNCVECGACRVICPYDNIEWKYPRWGQGISHRYG
ncbi:MAG: ferredoxin family protein [Candidatus Bathyarchaeia archaeon]